MSYTNLKQCIFFIVSFLCLQAIGTSNELSTSLLRPPRRLLPTEWLTTVRIQKTGSKTLKKFLPNLLAHARNTTVCKLRCPSTDFAASHIPRLSQLSLALAQAGNNSMKQRLVLQNEYDYRLQYANDHLSDFESHAGKRQPKSKSVEYAVLHNPEYPQSLLKRLRKEPKENRIRTVVPFAASVKDDAVKWYTGGRLAARSAMLCKRDVPGTDLTIQHPPVHKPLVSIFRKAAQCKLPYQPHLQIVDVFGALWETHGVRYSDTRRIFGIRDPVRRVLSEYKHTCLRTTPPGAIWDYCLDPAVLDFQKYCSKSDSDPGIRLKLFNTFIRSEYHAYGMRNRQTKMISGFVLEPILPTIQQLRNMPLYNDLTQHTDSNLTFTNKADSGVQEQNRLYMQWEHDALEQAKYILRDADSIIIQDRYPESFSLALYSFDLRPAIRFGSSNFKSSSILNDPFLFSPLADSQIMSSSNDTASSCDCCLEITENHLHGAFESIVQRPPDEDIVERPLDEDHWTCSDLTIDLVPWCRLLAVAKALVEQSTDREKADQASLPLDVNAAMIEEIKLLNRLDWDLLEWSKNLLNERIQLLQTILHQSQQKFQSQDAQFAWESIPRATSYSSIL